MIRTLRYILYIALALGVVLPDFHPIARSSADQAQAYEIAAAEWQDAEAPFSVIKVFDPSCVVLSHTEALGKADPKECAAVDHVPPRAVLAPGLLLSSLRHSSDI